MAENYNNDTQKLLNDYNNALQQNVISFEALYRNEVEKIQKEYEDALQQKITAIDVYYKSEIDSLKVEIVQLQEEVRRIPNSGMNSKSDEPTQYTKTIYTKIISNNVKNLENELRSKAGLSINPLINNAQGAIIFVIVFLATERSDKFIDFTSLKDFKKKKIIKL